MIAPRDPVALCPGCEAPKEPGRRCVACSEADEVLGELVALRSSVGAEFDDPPADPAPAPAPSSFEAWRTRTRDLVTGRARLLRRRSS